ncbi:hypothetical protein MOUN0_B00210 [Monosporozyma unispora]|nr:hypothetical protein C6P44_000978 [Kazachstania unispora]
MTKIFDPAPTKTRLDLNANILKAEYAIRGPLLDKVQAYEDHLREKPGSLPFDHVVNALIGNPQLLDQKPLTFTRQVLSIVQNPTILQHRDILIAKKIYNRDVIKRAELLISQVGKSMGTYTLTKGILGIRNDIANFITQRDGETCDPDDLYLTDGATMAIMQLFSLFAKDSKTGVLLPIPQYPLYTALLTMYNLELLPYYLNEEDGWSTDTVEIENVIKSSISNGTTPQAIVIINPGNPTGAILSLETLADILTIAAKYGIIVIADEVYQQNIFKKEIEFHSMKKVLRHLQKSHPQGEYNNVQLVSLHSASKGTSGECGQRGAFMEVVGFNDEVKEEILRLFSISLCAGTAGQVLVDLMVKTPQPGDESYELDQKERHLINNNMKERAVLLYDIFNNLEGFECQEPQGGMYLFPKLTLPQRAIEESRRVGYEPDEYYCHKLLDATGICVVPGTGFRQRPGTYHIRTTFLPPGTEWITRWKDYHLHFLEEYSN